MYFFDTACAEVARVACVVVATSQLYHIVGKVLSVFL